MRQAAVDEHPQGHAAHDGAQPDDAAFLPLALHLGGQRGRRERGTAGLGRDQRQPAFAELAQRVGGYGGLAFVGTPQTIADQMEEWLVGRGSDGFNIMFPYLPQGLFEFVDRVVPELQKRGIFRTEYEGRTLRENLGLPRPENQFFAG